MSGICDICVTADTCEIRRDGRKLCAAYERNSNYNRLYGTPERAARTLEVRCDPFHCVVCPAYHNGCEEGDYEALLEWLRQDNGATATSQERRQKMRVFISQPMKDRTDEEIKQERERIVAELSERYGNIEVIDSFFESAPHEAKPLWFLGKSIELLSTADVAYFADGWQDARGCRIEHACAAEYGIDIIEPEA